jgi:hypothetical protein
MATTVYTAIIEKEGDLHVALCPDLDMASQGATVEEATSTCERQSSYSSSLPMQKRSSVGVGPTSL